MAFNTLPLILASTSSIRRKLLAQAGVTFESIRPAVDEEELHQALNHLSPGDLAKALARHKAMEVSTRYPDAIVIGADQVLEFEGQPIHKATTRAKAEENLRRMLGKQHSLHSALAIVQGGSDLFMHQSTVLMQMRSPSEAFLNGYFAASAEALTGSVGGYYFEETGIQLFEKAEGDYFSILGLPLMPLLAFLRQGGIIES